MRAQIIKRQLALSALGVELAALEAALADITARLFALTPAERRVIAARP